MGPLASLRVVEFSGLGPGPLAGQLLADLGAQVIVIDRKAAPANPADINRRGKKSVVLDLKSPGGVEAAQRLIETADILIEGFRPGVMERLGLGPDDCPKRLIYGRMTGWGQSGPWAQVAGHDINYLAMTGALQAMGHADRPPAPPLNLVADFGGGSMFLIFGLLAAVIERGISGKGQVVDAAMVDGVPAMMGLIHGMLAQGQWSTARQANWLDGGAPYYRCYECADGGYISVGALEPQFFAQLVQLAGLPPEDTHSQNDPDSWPRKHALYAQVFATRTRDEWAATFATSDACVAPVLTFPEAAAHPVNSARDVFYSDQGVTQAAPAPRFGRSLPDRPQAPAAQGAHSFEVLHALGYSHAELDALAQSGAIGPI